MENVIPQEMRDLPHWVVCTKEKVPYQPGNPTKRAMANKPDTWGTYQQACKTLVESGGKFAGIGFQLMGSGIACIDIDKTKDGLEAPYAQEVIDGFPGAYVERSQSGIGYHIFVKGTTGVKTKSTQAQYPSVEIYGSDKGRYIWITGDTLESSGHDVPEMQKELDTLYRIQFPEPQKQLDTLYRIQFPEPQKQPVLSEGQSPARSDDEVIRLARGAQGGDIFSSLHDFGEHPDTAINDDRSSKELAFFTLLARWTHDHAQMERIGRNCELYTARLESDKPDKWDSHKGYLPKTFEKAIAGAGSNPLCDFDGLDTKQEAIKMQAGSLKEYFDSGKLMGEIEEFSACGDRKTGFANLDVEIGSLYPGLYVLGGISSLGKTTLAHQLGDQLAEKGEHILYFSLEQSRLELVSKSVARRAYQDAGGLSTVTSLHVRRGQSRSNWEPHLKRYIETVGERITVVEGNFSCNVKEIESITKKHKTDTGATPIVIIDYLQIIPTHNDRLSDKQKVDQIVTRLKQLSRDLQTVVIVLSSFNRDNYLTPVNFGSFKESGGIEYTADVVWGLQLSVITTPEFSQIKEVAKQHEAIKEAKNAEARKIELVCLKNRYGKSSYSVHFDYRAARDTFSSAEGRHAIKPR